jgi:hypothetical protein
MGGRDATGQALGFGDEPERPLGDQYALFQCFQMGIGAIL